MIPVRSTYYALQPVVSREWRDFSKTSWSEKWRMWRRGFVSTSALRYDFEHARPDEYIPDWAYFLRVGRINRPYSFLLDNKLAFHMMMQPFAEHLPECFALARAGRLLPLRRSDDAPKLRLSDYARREGRVVLKRTIGHGGRGIEFVRHVGGDRFEVNGTPQTPAELDQRIHRRHDVLVCEAVEQHSVFARLYPRTTNSVRVLTFWGDDIDAPFVGAATVTFGTSHSYPVDRGGIVAPIDLSTGIIGEGSCRRTGVRTHSHTETGERIEGQPVPHWKELTENLLQIVRSLPHLPYVGWDIAVTEDGFKILEGNNCPAILFIQSFQPLLRDPRVRGFFERHGVIQRRGGG
jgi:hypothetical protein